MDFKQQKVTNKENQYKSPLATTSSDTGTSRETGCNAEALAGSTAMECVKLSLQTHTACVVLFGGQTCGDKARSCIVCNYR